ncbi:MAG: phosphate/phosphite/phosphonate ABC transporter substrate-binding protein [Phyllobacterium sp.]
MVWGRVRAFERHTPMARHARRSVLAAGLWAAAMLALFLRTADADDPAATRLDAYRLGVFPYVPVLTVDRIFGPVAAQFAEDLGRPVHLKTKSTFGKFAEELRKETYDIILVHPFFYVEARDQHHYVPLARLDEPLTAVVMVRADDPIETLADLKGKTIGVGPLGAQLHQVTVALLLKNGVSPADVRFANVGSSADVYRAVVAGVVDAGPSQIDNIPDAKNHGVHQIKGGDMWSDLKEYPFQGGYASDETITNKRDLILRTLAAYATLFRFLSGPDSHDAFFAARRAALGKSGEAFDSASEFQWNFIQKTQPFALDLVLAQDGVDYVQDLNIRLDIQKQKLPYDKVVDASLARDAIKLV